MKNEKKQLYLAPQVLAVSLSVERGFAGSGAISGGDNGQVDVTQEGARNDNYVSDGGDDWTGGFNW